MAFARFVTLATSLQLKMSLGLLLHLFNGIYFRQPYDIFFEFIPRFLFLMSTFGYLVAMIFIKWYVELFCLELILLGTQITLKTFICPTTRQFC